MAEDEIIMDEDSIALEDVEESETSDKDVSGIVPFVMERYTRAEDYRYNDEERWLRSYRNYRGLYGSDVQFTEAEKSRVFIKITKTKTLALLMYYLQATNFLLALSRQSYLKVLSLMSTLIQKSLNSLKRILNYLHLTVLQVMARIYLKVLQKKHWQRCWVLYKISWKKLKAWKKG